MAIENGFAPDGNKVGKYSISPMPAESKNVTQGNYLNFHDGSADWTQQFLPELYEAEVERYGNRTLGGFLRMVGAEMPMTSDQVIWSEQERLHIGYDLAIVKSATTLEIDMGTDITCAIRKGATLAVSGTSTKTGHLGIQTVKVKATAISVTGNDATVTVSVSI